MLKKKKLVEEMSALNKKSRTKQKLEGGLDKAGNCTIISFSNEEKKVKVV